MPVALITGGAGSLGGAAARRLLQDGWLVVIADLDEAAARDVASSMGERAVAMAMDVTKLEDVRRGVDDVIARLGSIDAVVTSAGGRFGADIGAFMEAPTDTWTQIVELHLTGVLNVYYAALPHMRARRAGSLVAVSAPEAYRGSPEAAAFSTAKAAIAVLTETLVRECQPYNIRVNSVIPPAPGAQMLAGGNDICAIVAEAIAHLVSDKAALTTGSALDCSNGAALH